jgi:hypothetical protein
METSPDCGLDVLAVTVSASEGMSFRLLKFSGGSVDDYAICRSSRIPVSQTAPFRLPHG